MGAQATNALIYLISTLFNLYMGAVLLRIVLQWVRADFYNPISQLVWKITQPVLTPFAKLIPRWRKLDVAALLLLIILSIIFVQIVGSLYGRSIGFVGSIGLATLKIVSLGISIYTASIIIYAILSWFGPGLSNPSANILYSINEPLLRPIRKIIPPLSGLDLSPLVAILLLQLADRFLGLPGYFGLG